MSSPSQIYTLNGTSGSVAGGASGIYDPRPLKLFYDGFNARIYSVRVYEDGELMLDLIPVRVGKEGFMYDKVSSKLYGNSGDGMFIIGPDIN